MKVIIPAAGEGTRLRPFTLTESKVLLPVAGKPILAHILDPLVRLKPEKVIFIVSSHKEKIAKFVRRNYPFKTGFIVQKKALGLGHAVSLALSEIGEEPVLIILGDTIVDPRVFRKFDKAHDWLGVKSVRDPRRFGVAEVKRGYVTNLVEKPENPKSNLALVGLYYIKSTQIFKKALKTIVGNKVTHKGEFQLTDALQLMIKAGVRFKAVDVINWYDCGKIETWLESNKRLLAVNGNRSGRHEGSIVLPPVYVDRTAQIGSSILGPYVSVMEKVSVQNSIIRESILSRGSRVRYAVIENSIIGPYARVMGKLKRINLAGRQKIEA